ncbi:histone-fold-containing protein [Trichophaea hybrida]|nr:histone-fold-containing protein [Trichophaea hybrida]
MKQKGTRRRKNLTTKPEVVDDDSGYNNSDSPQHLVTNSLTSTAPRQVLIKTKFPVARIKRIMQADEDVGKVAQVTPVVVSKALELFMIALCDKASEQARQRHCKRITAGHLKQAIIHEEQFDFLADIIEKVPDASLPPDGSSLTNVAIDSEDCIPGKRTRKPRQRKMKDEDAF